jgi:hypothetical protein
MACPSSTERVLPHPGRMAAVDQAQLLLKKTDGWMVGSENKKSLTKLLKTPPPQIIQCTPVTSSSSKPRSPQRPSS